MPDAHQEALSFLYSRLNYERTGMPRIPAELRLGRMRRLLRRLGDPQDTLKIVHVAGTKGKGSTAAMIASALSASGVVTGLFCSPHLHRLEERFRVDGVEATREDLISLVDAVRPAVEHFDSDVTHHRHRGPTFFEITTAMGLIHFARRRTGAVLLEVGLGGRLDSTNCVRPHLAVITSISYDHTKQLGTTLGAIAGEKAGILKRGGVAVSGVGPGEARAAIRRVAEARQARLIEIDEDFRYECLTPPRPLVKPTPCRVRVATSRRTWGPIDLPLLGPHQAHNAAVAIATLDALADRGFTVSPSNVARGWATLDWPARVEVFAGSPLIVIDGAHNVASAEALAETLRVCFPEAPRTLIFGTTREKDLPGQLRALLPLFDRVIATRYLENPRSVPPDEVASLVVGKRVETAASPREAIDLARRWTPDDGIIVVTGSLFLAAESRACLLAERR
jgi:dihydrofolate synthase / folylpolyglutamate synthase